MRFYAYVILMFAIALVFYLMGYQPVLFYVFQNQGSGFMNAQDVLMSFARMFTSEQGLTYLLALAVVGVVATLTGSFAALYIIPLLMLVAILNFLIFPFSFVFDPALPEIIKVPVVVFFNLITILALSTFIRGQS